MARHGHEATNGHGPPLIAAIYARKSNEQNIADEEKSTTRQIAHAKAYALRKGWRVLDAYVYEGDGISGAEFGEHRPGLARLLNAVGSRAPFQIVIMSEESRLGREQWKVGYTLSQLADAGVGVAYYLEDRQPNLSDPTAKFMESVKNYAAEMEREKARQRTYDALARKARALHVTGGKVFGYDNVEIRDASGRRLHVVRKINPDQATVIRRIFEEAADGTGFTRLAKLLNSEAVPPPRQGGTGWAPTAIRELLHRQLYRGVLLWNRTQKIEKNGTGAVRRRPESEWFRVDAPDLQIVSESLWKAAHAQLDKHRSLYSRASNGQLLARPSLDYTHDSPYLLSGLARCTECGGSLVALTRGSTKERTRFYGCAYHHQRGTTVCRNGLLIKQTILDHAVLAALAAALDEQLIARAVDLALARLRSGREQTLDRRAQIERELSLIEAKIAKLGDAIGAGRAIETLLGLLEVEEARKKTLVHELSRLPEIDKVTSLDTGRWTKAVAAKVADVRGLLGQHVPQAREMLRKLVDGRLACTPYEKKNGQKGYRFTGRVTYRRLLQPDVQAMVVAPTGFSMRTCFRRCHSVALQRPPAPLNTGHLHAAQRAGPSLTLPL
jgi:DNA invertase Pin-like site-specific DNA recombinase